MSGHAVLAVPVPALEEYVRARTAHHDAAWVSADPDFVHAHVTLLAPWLDDPTPADLCAVAEVAAGADPFDVALDGVAQFPDGTLHLRPEPDGPFLELGAALARAFPQCPPYAGRHPGSVPHLTLDLVAPGVDAASVAADVVATSGPLPVAARAERVDLQWWEAGGCHRRATWALGRGSD